MRRLHGRHIALCQLLNPCPAPAHLAAAGRPPPRRQECDGLSAAVQQRSSDLRDAEAAADALQRVRPPSPPAGGPTAPCRARRCLRAWGRGSLPFMTGPRGVGSESRGIKAACSVDARTAVTDARATRVRRVRTRKSDNETMRSTCHC